MKEQALNTNPKTSTASPSDQTSLPAPDEVVNPKHLYQRPEIRVTCLQTENGFSNGSVTFLNGANDININEWESGTDSSEDIYF
ncbi:MAG: hypothetical protein QM654_16915 [Dysgonamonadaceae bacterium]